MKILILYIAILLSACMSTTTNQDLSTEFPLLERNENLRYGKEWENMHNLYTKYIQDIRLQPKKGQSYIELAELFMVEARVTGEHGHYYPAALKLLEKGSSLAQENKDLQFRALSDKASVQLSLHQFTAAKSTAESALQYNPYNAQIYGALVDANVELGNYEEAVRLSDKMISIRPDLRSYSRVSYLREIYGDLPGAIEAMQLAYDAGYPGYEETAWTGLQLGDLYKKAGDPSKAKMIYQQIMTDRPGYAFAMAAIADLYLDQQHIDSAELLIDQAIKQLPEVSFYITKSKIKKLQNKTNEVAALSREILQMLQDDEAAGHTMDLTYADVYKDILNDVPTSLTYALKEYKVRPENKEVNKYLAEIYTTMGDSNKASFHKSKAVTPTM